MVVILGAQPGAGKTELQRITEAEFGGNIVNCNADLFRDYHPDAEKIKSKHEAYYPQITAEYAQQWNKGLRKYCEDNRLNYILETTFSSGQVMNKTIAELQDKGYRVEIKLLAVDPKLSLLGTYLRFEAMKATEGNGRLVGKDAHDTRYYMVAPTIFLVDKDGRCNKLQVYGRELTQRNGMILQGVNLLATNPKDPLNVFLKEVDKPWSTLTKLHFEQGVARVTQMMQSRNAPLHEINSFTVEMKMSYPSTAEMQLQTQQLIHEQLQASLLEKRLTGELPTITIGKVDFVIDLAHNELREAGNPAHKLPINNMTVSQDGKSLYCYYHIGRHEIYQPADDIKSLPKNVRLLQIPSKERLDPYGLAIQSGKNVKGFLSEHPLSEKLSAVMYPLSESRLPEIIKENLRLEQQKENTQRPNRGMSI